MRDTLCKETFQNLPFDMMLKIALRAIQGTDIIMAGPGCKKDGLSQRRCWQVLSHHCPESLFDCCVVPFAHVH